MSDIFMNTNGFSSKTVAAVANVGKVKFGSFIACLEVDGSYRPGKLTDNHTSY